MEEKKAANSDDTVAKKRRRSGSEQRQKSQVKFFRVSPEEDAELTAAHERVGMSFGAYARTHLLTTVKTRGRSKRSDLKAEVIRLQGYTNRVGGNLHQLLKRVNFGEITEGAEVAALLRPMIADYEQAIGAIMQTLGRGTPA